MLNFFLNQKVDLMQKTAWRLVRAAEDKLGDNAGSEKRVWCIDRMQESFSKEKRDDLETYVRAAYMSFQVENSMVR